MISAITCRNMIRDMIDRKRTSTLKTPQIGDSQFHAQYGSGSLPHVRKAVYVVDGCKLQLHSKRHRRKIQKFDLRLASLTAPGLWTALIARERLFRAQTKAAEYHR